MDWMAQLYGLSEDFYNSTGVGGGVIQVSRTARPLHVHGGLTECRSEEHTSELQSLV